MAVRITPRRVIPVNDNGTVVRLLASPRRTASPPPARIALTAVTRAVPAGMRQVGRNDPDYLGITPGSAVRSPAARGNAVALVTAVQAVDVSEDDTPLAPNFYRMAAYERETVGAVAAVGGDQRFLFAGQRGVWEDEDSEHGMTNPRRQSNPDSQLLRPGQRAIWRDEDSVHGSNGTKQAATQTHSKNTSGSLDVQEEPDPFCQEHYEALLRALAYLVQRLNAMLDDHCHEYDAFIERPLSVYDLPLDCINHTETWSSHTTSAQQSQNRVRNELNSYTGHNPPCPDPNFLVSSSVMEWLFNLDGFRPARHQGSLPSNYPPSTMPSMPVLDPLVQSCGGLQFGPWCIEITESQLREAMIILGGLHLGAGALMGAGGGPRRALREAI